MLIRTFRLTDKLSNALLRILVWLSDGLLDQIFHIRLAVVGSLQALWLTVIQALQSGRIVYQSPEERRALMARRTAEAAARTALREDPLKTQNRALSMFTVALMAALLIMILWFTNNGALNTSQTPRSSGNVLLPLQTQGGPTPLPTLIPTSTPIPDALNDPGSIVYSVRQNGRDNLWVLGIGQSSAIRLTDTATDDVDPVWNPRGDRIAFASRRDGNWDLYVLDVATGNVSRLTYTLDYERSPSWSPDGTYIAYESYLENNLDIYIIKADGTENAQRVTFNPAPDYSPAWSTVNGRRLAYVSLRDNNQEIYILDLGEPIEDKAIRLTNTPDIDEDFPVWSPDEQTIAYSARVDGNDLVFTKSVSQPELEPTTIGRGRQPTWSPSGANLLFALGSGQNTTLISTQVGTVGIDALAVSVTGQASSPSWTKAELPISLLQTGGFNSVKDQPLYEEKVQQAPSAPFYLFRELQGIAAPQPFLSDRADDSFIALRAAVNAQTGNDFLGNLKDAMWQTDYIPEPGQSRQSWHYAGRAFSFDRNLVFGQGDQPSSIEVVREDIGVNTYWRVYIRAPEEYQNGQLGAPLKQLPWDMASRLSGEPQAFEQGGRKKVAVPSGYYIDFTQIAEDYGWVRVPSDRTWRSLFSGILYWEYNKRDGLDWTTAMLELYSKEQLSVFLTGPTPVPTTLSSTATPDDAPTWTPTPLPPDASSGG